MQIALGLTMHYLQLENKHCEERTSFIHSLLQPSKLIKFPSSHSSLPSIILFPQTEITSHAPVA